MKIKDLLLLALELEKKNYLFFTYHAVNIRHPELRSLLNELSQECLRQIFLLETLIEEKVNPAPVVKKLISLFRK